MVREKLHPLHIAILTYMVQSGVMVFVLPRLTAENYGRNGWLSIVIFSAAATLSIFLISLVFRLGKETSILHIAESLVWKPLLIPVYLVLVSLLAFTGCMVGKEFILIFQMIAFPTTNPMIFKGVFDILALLLLLKGIYNISKAATVFFFLTIWMMALLLFYLGEFEWARLTPFLFRGDTSYVHGGVEIFTAFLGFEICMFLAPYAERVRSLFKAVYIGNLLTTVVYLSVAIVAYGFFSFGQLVETRYPVLDLLAYIELPFIERMENFLFTFFLLLILISSVMYFWMAEEILNHLAPRIQRKWLSVFVVFGSFCFSYFPSLIREVEMWLRWLAYAELVLVFIIPVLLIGLLLIRRWRKGENYAA
ncbi:spore gernimation protein [Xylanibacillus composti]|uniref:Germination protein n=1 Tax=Xylanibacillus composti TaxID=1572762 RepID=A0A8J4H4V1_9BACL|nr:GerAB/ArcD/ProY family transporter [Xylanibacillus composti]MDT9726970.1 spore gernimation protein [Xylanibacillus composti]GIQ69526.1 germination protein [Xylanibacillus composti]